MFILYAVLAGLVIGLMGGGQPTALGDLRFRWGALMLMGFLTQVILFSDAVAERVGAAGPIVYVVSTALVGIAIVRNLAIPGIPLVLLGAASNLAAILANGGFMPAAPGALAATAGLGMSDTLVAVDVLLTRGLAERTPRGIVAVAR